MIAFKADLSFVYVFSYIRTGHRNIAGLLSRLPQALCKVFSYISTRHGDIVCLLWAPWSILCYPGSKKSRPLIFWIFGIRDNLASNLSSWMTIESRKPRCGEGWGLPRNWALNVLCDSLLSLLGKVHLILVSLIFLPLHSSQFGQWCAIVASKVLYSKVIKKSRSERQWTIDVRFTKTRTHMSGQQEQYVSLNTIKRRKLAYLAAGL